MRRMTSFDEMVQFDDTMDRFEELCRHGYSFDRAIQKLEDEDTWNDLEYWENY